jgi:hypothetical protein
MYKPYNLSIYCIRVPVLVFCEMFSYSCIEWLSRDVDKDVTKIAYGFLQFVQKVAVHLGYGT